MQCRLKRYCIRGEKLLYSTPFLTKVRVCNSRSSSFNSRLEEFTVGGSNSEFGHISRKWSSQRLQTDQKPALSKTLHKNQPEKPLSHAKPVNVSGNNTTYCRIDKMYFFFPCSVFHKGKVSGVVYSRLIVFSRMLRNISFN